MKSIKVFLDDNTSYETSVAEGLSIQDLRNYWLDARLNVGAGENDLMKTCIGFEYEGTLHKAMAWQEKELRTEFEAKGIKCYNTKEMQEHFSVKGFSAPFCMVEEKATGKTGTLEFTHMPRLYVNFIAD